MTLQPGDPAPPFTLTSDTGAPVSLVDHAGERVVLYFYPAAMTPGCTTQACDFRDALPQFREAGYTVIGISPDTPEKLAAFRERDGLTFPLLSDPDHAVAEAYGAWGQKKNYGKTYEGLIRSTVVVGTDGRVEWARNNVRATGHVGLLRRELGLG